MLKDIFQKRLRESDHRQQEWVSSPYAEDTSDKAAHLEEDQDRVVIKTHQMYMYTLDWQFSIQAI